MYHDFQTATSENSAAIYRLGETSPLPSSGGGNINITPKSAWEPGYTEIRTATSENCAAIYRLSLRDHTYPEVVV